MTSVWSCPGRWSAVSTSHEGRRRESSRTGFAPQWFMFYVKAFLPVGRGFNMPSFYLQVMGHFLLGYRKNMLLFIRFAEVDKDIGGFLSPLISSIMWKLLTLLISLKGKILCWNIYIFQSFNYLLEISKNQGDT